MRTPSTTIRPLALALALAAIAAPSAAQASQRNLSMPDTRDAAAILISSHKVASRGAQNLSMPDTRDAAEGRTLDQVAPPVIVTSRTSSGFDWGAGAIGAGGAVGLVAMLSAGAIAFRRRPALT